MSARKQKVKLKSAVIFNDSSEEEPFEDYQGVSIRNPSKVSLPNISSSINLSERETSSKKNQNFQQTFMTAGLKKKNSNSGYHINKDLDFIT